MKKRWWLEHMFGITLIKEFPWKTNLIKKKIKICLSSRWDVFLMPYRKSMPCTSVNMGTCIASSMTASYIMIDVLCYIRTWNMSSTTTLVIVKCQQRMISTCHWVCFQPDRGYVFNLPESMFSTYQRVCFQPTREYVFNLPHSMFSTCHVFSIHSGP